MIPGGDITSRLFLGIAEIVAEFDDPGDAAAARANLEIFLRWALDGAGKPPPPVVILIVTQSKLDPVDDRPRRVDWEKRPVVRQEGALVAVDAPRSKSARDTVRRVLKNSHARSVYNRNRLPTESERTRALKRVALSALGAALVIAVAAVVFHLVRK